MSYDYFNFPNPYSGNPAPGYNYGKIIQTVVDVEDSWPSVIAVRNQLNLYDDSSQDTLLAQFRNAARRVIESYLGRSIGATPSTYDVYYPASVFQTQTFAVLTLPSDDASTITVSQVNYYNSVSTPVKTLIPATNYFFDPTGTKIILNTFPMDVNLSMSLPIVASISVKQSDTISTDPIVIHAALLLITHYYNNRSAYTDMDLKALPAGISTLLSPYKDLYI